LRGHYAIYEPLEIAWLLHGDIECHFLPFGDCTMSQNAQNAIFLPLELARSLRGGSKCHIWAFRDCAVIALWLKKPYLGLWRLRGHCAVA